MEKKIITYGIESEISSEVIIPKDIWDTEIKEIVPYYDRISIEIK